MTEGNEPWLAPSRRIAILTYEARDSLSFSASSSPRFVPRISSPSRRVYIIIFSCDFLLFDGVIYRSPQRVGARVFYDVVTACTVSVISHFCAHGGMMAVVVVVDLSGEKWGG